MTTEHDSSSPPKQARTLVTKARMKGAALALGGMIAGSFVGIGVQLGVESTGLLGPSVESLMAEQKSNFDDVAKRIEALQASSADPETRKSLAELNSLLKRQDELAQQASAELHYLGEQVETFKKQQLADSGYTGGADFWLKGGESVNVAGENQVFALLGARSTFADVNLSGQRKRISVGDALEVQSGDRTCKLFYKQATPRADRRVGFDLDCS